VTSDAVEHASKNNTRLEIPPGEIKTQRGGNRERNSLDGMTAGTSATGAQHVKVASSSGVSRTASRLEKIVLIHHSQPVLRDASRQDGR
jgi:hypothetical protein